jgi:phenylpyruvate tautomerase PptA (4-oxalocrotonate tautomerase family)
MPIARIDLRRGKDAPYRQAISHAVYQAMVAVGVPENDRFQVITEHDADNFVFDPTYLGIQRDDDLVMIQVTWNEGRSLEQKQTFYRMITDGLVKSPGIRPENVLINLVEVKKENWSFGNGVATYAS